MPPALLMRSTAIWTPTSAVLPMIAAEPESGCIVPILYGLAAAKAARHGAANIVAPNPAAPVAAEWSMRRRVILPWQRGMANSFPVLRAALATIGDRALRAVAREYLLPVAERVQHGGAVDSRPRHCPCCQRQNPYRGTKMPIAGEK